MVLQLLQGHFWNAGCLAYNNTLLYSSWALVSEKIEGRRRKIYSRCISKSGLGGSWMSELNRKYACMPLDSVFSKEKKERQIG